jgi:hypothetical protein
MSIDFEKTMAILNGQSVESFMKSQLTEQDKTQIDNAIDVLFSGLSLRNWLGGVKLRDAWTSALDTLRDAIFAVSYNNPATLYARQSVFYHRNRWQSQIIASHEANNIIQCPDNERDTWQQSAETKIQNGLEILRQKFLEFESGTPRATVTQKTEILRTPENTRTIGERENERERER